MIVFSEIKRCQLPHSSQFFQKQKSAASQWLPFRQSPLREFFSRKPKHTRRFPVAHLLLKPFRSKGSAGFLLAHRSAAPGYPECVVLSTSSHCLLEDAFFVKCGRKVPLHHIEGAASSESVHSSTMRHALFDDRIKCIFHP